MKRTSKYLLIILLGMSVFILWACISKKHPEINTRYYILEYDSPHLDHRPQLSAVIRIERFTVAPLYTTNKMVFKPGPHQRNVYGYHRWRANPADMVSFMLIRDMRHAELFTAIASPGKQVPATHVIEGSVDEFFEDDSMNPGEAVLHITITLLRYNESNSTKAVMFQKKYNVTQTCEDKTPQAFAESMSQAMRDISRQILVDTYNILAEQSAEP